jgi:hypothetical protein
VSDVNTDQLLRRVLDLEQRRLALRALRRKAMDTRVAPGHLHEKNTDHRSIYLTGTHLKQREKFTARVFSRVNPDSKHPE